MFESGMLASLHGCATTGDACVFLPGSLTPKRIVDGNVIDARFVTWRDLVELQARILTNRLPTRFPVIGLFFRPNSKNYGHCLIETLPLLHILNSARYANPITVPETAKLPFMPEALSCYKNLNFHYLSPGEVVRADTGHYVPPGCNPDVDSAILPNARFLAAAMGVAKGEGPKRFHVTRASRRRIANEDEISGILDTYGFVTLDFANMTLAQQIEFSLNGEVMFAAHGAGIANSIFMKPGATIIEAASPVPARQDTYYSELSRKTGKNHVVLRGLRRDHSVPPERNEDFLVSPFEFENLLRNMGLSKR